MNKQTKITTNGGDCLYHQYNTSFLHSPSNIPFSTKVKQKKTFRAFHTIKGVWVEVKAVSLLQAKWMNYGVPLTKWEEKK